VEEIYHLENFSGPGASVNSDKVFARTQHAVAGWFRSPYAFLLLIFAVSRVVYYLFGVRFDARGVPTFLQFIDTELLRHHLLQSLFYLHWLPPGYNLFIGIVLKLFPLPHDYTVALHVINCMFGMAITCSLFYCIKSLGVGKRLALAVAALFAISPGVVLFENFPLYEYQMAFLLMVGAGFLFHFIKYRSAVSAVAFLLCQFWMVMVRNQYHMVYFVLIFVLVWYFSEHHRRLVAWVGSVLLAVILSLYLKNLIVFGLFVSSTYMEMNMSTLLLARMSSGVRHSFVAQGKLSPTAAHDSLYGDGQRYGLPVSAFRPYITMPPKTSVPVLDQEFKSSGVVNYNHAGYLEARKLFKKDIRFIMLHYPIAYARSVAVAWFTYFLPPDDFQFFNDNLSHIRGIQRFFDVVFFGQFRQAPHEAIRQLHAQGAGLSLVLYSGVFLLIGLPALFIFGCRYLYRGVRKRTIDAPQALLLGFLLFNIAYCTMTANFLSSCENNRYRFPVDGFFVVLAALALDQMWRKIIYHRRLSAGGSMADTCIRSNSLEKPEHI
jgi:hypothetical protein